MVLLRDTELRNYASDGGQHFFLCKLNVSRNCWSKSHRVCQILNRRNRIFFKWSPDYSCQVARTLLLPLSSILYFSPEPLSTPQNYLVYLATSSFHDRLLVTHLARAQLSLGRCNTYAPQNHSACRTLCPLCQLDRGVRQCE